MDFVIKFLTEKSVANYLSFPGLEGLELIDLQHFNQKASHFIFEKFAKGLRLISQVETYVLCAVGVYHFGHHYHFIRVTCCLVHWRCWQLLHVSSSVIYTAIQEEGVIVTIF